MSRMARLTVDPTSVHPETFGVDRLQVQPAGDVLSRREPSVGLLYSETKSRVVLQPAALLLPAVPDGQLIARYLATGSSADFWSQAIA